MNIMDEQRREDRFIFLYRKLINANAHPKEDRSPENEVTHDEMNEYVNLAEYFKYNGRLEMLKAKVKDERLVDS